MTPTVGHDINVNGGSNGNYLRHVDGFIYEFIHPTLSYRYAIYIKNIISVDDTPVGSVFTVAQGIKQEQHLVAYSVNLEYENMLDLWINIGKGNGYIP